MSSRRVLVVNTRSTNRVENIATPSFPSEIRLMDTLKGKAWTYKKTDNTRTHASYSNTQEKVQFRFNKTNPMRIWISSLYYSKAKNSTNAPAAAILQALRRLAPKVSLLNYSCVSHDCMLPRSYLPNEYDIYHGARPSYANMKDLAPYRRITSALLSKSESLNAIDVLQDLKSLYPMDNLESLHKSAAAISAASKKGGLSLKETLDILKESGLTYNYRNLAQTRTFRNGSRKRKKGER